MCGGDVLSCDCVAVFCFKQKTAYEMRISDWSSDVCSSDLAAGGAEKRMPVDAFVRADRQQAELAVSGEFTGVLAVLRRRNIVPGEQRQLDVGDAHGRPSYVIGDDGNPFRRRPQGAPMRRAPILAIAHDKRSGLT